MASDLSKVKTVLTREEAKAEFIRHGQSVASWAKKNGFPTALVNQVLNGSLSCLRGKSHEIAVRLGIKDGVIGSGFGEKDHEAN